MNSASCDLIYVYHIYFLTFKINDIYYVKTKKMIYNMFQVQVVLTNNISNSDEKKKSLSTYIFNIYSVYTVYIQYIDYIYIQVAWMLIFITVLVLSMDSTISAKYS